MPLIQVRLIEGRSPAQVGEFARAVTAAAVTTLSVPADTVRVIVDEVPVTHFFVGGRSKGEFSSRPDPTDQKMA